MEAESYEYYLRASAGMTKKRLVFFENGKVQCETQWSGMGKGYNFRLFGRYEVLSDAFGRIHIDRVENLTKSDDTVHIEVLGQELIYEYAKVKRSPLLRHPADALWVNGLWPDFFDLILLTDSFVIECLYALQHAISEGFAADTYAEWIEHINAELINHLEILVLDLNDTKLMKIES